MKKKTIGRLAAVSLAAMTAIPSVAIVASATALTNTTLVVNESNSSYVTGDVFKVAVTGSNGVATYKYYTTETAATTVAGDDSDAVTRVNVLDVSSTIYVLSTGEISLTSVSGATRYYTGTPSSSGTTTSTGSYSYTGAATNYAGSSVYYSIMTDKFYPNYYSAYRDTIAQGFTAYTSSSYIYPTLSYTNAGYTSSTKYFDYSNGRYYTVDTGDTVVIYGYNTSYDSTSTTSTSTYGRYLVNGRYYPTYAEALSAAGSSYSITTLATYSAPQTNYFSYTTGYYYATYAAALSASGNNTSNVRTFSYYSSDYYYDGYYYDGYYYGDPYYYYWLSKYGTSSSDSSSSSSSDTTTAAVGNRKGWTSVATYLGKLSSGSSVKVSMNTETTIPSSVTSAIKGKNVTVQFVLNNGTVFTINGKDISSAKDIDISTTYNTSNVPSKLVKAAYKKNDAVSTAQISINSDSFGAAADITVKFAAKRAGYTAKLYRYNSSKQTLSLVDSAKIQDTGKCTFGEVTKGGDFVIVIC